MNKITPNRETLESSKDLIHCSGYMDHYIILSTLVNKPMYTKILTILRDAYISDRMVYTPACKVIDLIADDIDRITRGK